MIEAEEAAAFGRRAGERAKAAREAARQGRKLHGRKPKDPAAALAQAPSRPPGRAGPRAGQAGRAGGQDRGRRGRRPPAGRLRARPRPRAGARRGRPRRRRARRPGRAAATVGQVNVTDPDSRIMKTAHGWVQGYNAQAIANQHQIVLACHVSQHTGDVLLYQPMMTRLTRHPGRRRHHRHPRAWRSPTPATGARPTPPPPAPNA